MIKYNPILEILIYLYLLAIKLDLADYLLTNFHLPKSTLFILTCAYAGIEKMHNAYKHAIEKNYRFYSLGDACLIKKANL